MRLYDRAAKRNTSDDVRSDACMTEGVRKDLSKE